MGAAGVTRNPPAWEQHNDEALVNDVPAVTTTPRRFKAPLLFQGVEEASWIFVQLEVPEESPVQPGEMGV